MFEGYPDTPGTRPGSPKTAYEAAESVKDAARSRSILALDFIRSRSRTGATSDEIAAQYDWERYSSRPRVAELRAQGKIVDSGRRREGASGRRQAVWIAKEFADPEPAEQADLLEGL